MVTQAVRFASLREKHRLLGGTDMPVFGKSMGSGEPEVVDYQRSCPADDFPNKGCILCCWPAPVPGCSWVLLAAEFWSVVVQLVQNSLA